MFIRHDPIEGQQVGNLLVSRFMKGIFELRIPEPKSCSTWSVEKVLRHFNSLEPLASLSLKDLGLKLTILLALTSAARAHELAALGLRCLNHYLQCTEQIREGDNLLISYVRPHNAVGSQTISIWLCAAIQKAGVELSIKDILPEQHRRQV